MNDNSLVLSTSGFSSQTSHALRATTALAHGQRYGPARLVARRMASQRLELTRECGFSTLAAARRSARFFGQRVRRNCLGRRLLSSPTKHGRIEERVLDLRIPGLSRTHALPFSERSFDAIVSFDAYHYFGTDDLYLGLHIVRS